VGGSDNPETNDQASLAGNCEKKSMQKAIVPDVLVVT